jgi:hypothetical protein
MDRQSVYTLSLGFSQGSQADEEPDSRQHIQQQLVDFILEFQIDNVFLYRCVNNAFLPWMAGTDVCAETKFGKTYS